ncbi:hypothetical protein STEG23_024396 [Scotinomys teguina]
MLNLFYCGKQHVASFLVGLDYGRCKDAIHINMKDENLWIASRLIWFDQSRPPDSSQTAPVKIGPSP